VIAGIKEKVEPRDISLRIASLSPAKLEVLFQRLRTRSAPPEIRIIPRKRDTGYLPLSFSQQRLWFLDQLEPGSAIYNVPVAVRIRGGLSYQTMRLVINEIARRHESLRTTFDMVADRPAQIIAPRAAIAVPLVDLGELPAAKREAEAQRLLIEEAQKPFNLHRGPLLRVMLLRLDGEDYVAALTMHHIISDAWSMAILIRETGALYDAFAAGEPSPLEELPIQFTDYTLWQRDRLEDGIIQEQLAYWRRQLAGSLPVLHLPTSGPRPPAQTFRGANEHFILSNELSEAIRELCQREGATLFMVLLAAFKISLHKYTGRDDVIVGSSMANRSRAELEQIIGFLVNSVVLRTDLTGDPTFSELVGRVRETALGAYANQDLPFEKLVEELRPQRTLSHSPLFQVMFDFGNALIEPLQLRIGGLTIAPLHVENGTSKFEMTLFIREMGQQVVGKFEYNTDLFDAATIRRMSSHYQFLLAQVAANPQRRISSLSLIESSQKQEMINSFSDLII
jgi:condensation domain-containing protein